MATKRKQPVVVPEDEDPVEPDEEVFFVNLGGGNEVGRSCHIIQYKGKTVMLDAGQHPAYDGIAALPYFDEFDLSTVDVLLVSHSELVQKVICLLHGMSAWKITVYALQRNFDSVQAASRGATISCHLLSNAIHCSQSGVQPRCDLRAISSPILVHIIQGLCINVPLGTRTDFHSFHVDHASALPYVLSKTNFKGRVFMTHPTKAIYKWLIQDSVRVGNTSSSDQKSQLYTEADHFATFPRIETIDYYSTHTISSIRITPYPAGHVLGAAMFLIEIAGLKIFFTGDYSREDDRHLISAQVPKNIKVDVLITESTYGISSHVPRAERETALMRSITGILNRGGRALLPVFALGRAQELLLILDEYWARHPEYQRYPIFYASNLARKCMVVYQTYIGSMNDNIKRMFRDRMAEAEQNGEVGKGGPWDFRYIRSLKNLEKFDDVGGSVVLASPGMLQNGVSRELLERWAPNDRNGVIITGYSVEGTMAKEIMTEPEQIPAIMTNRNAGAINRGGRVSELDRPMIPRRCTVQEFSFAAHVDGVENREFIEELAAPVVILVHGEKHNMMRLKSKLLSLNADKTNKLKVYSPANSEELRIPFRTEKSAKVVGRLAETNAPLVDESDDSHLVSGVLVQNDFKLSLMAPDDLREYAGLTTTTVMCKQRLTLASASIDLIRWVLESTFGSIEKIGPDVLNGWNYSGEENREDEDAEPADEEVDRLPKYAYLIMGCVMVQYENLGEITVEWEGNVMNDGIADAVMSALYTVESSPAAVKYSSKSHSHSHGPAVSNPHANITPEERLSRLLMFLEAQFGSSITPIETPKSLWKESTNGTTNGVNGIKAESPDAEDDESPRKEEELDRLHSLGIPVPGLEIRVDKNVARVWLETLEIDCTNAVLRDRVKAVVERAVETLAPFWDAQGKGSS